jgi:hypothetical protein
MPTMNKPDLLEKVRAKLMPFRGAMLVSLAENLGISYDTLLRIRDAKTDPVYSNVLALAKHFKLVQK